MISSERMPRAQMIAGLRRLRMSDEDIAETLDFVVKHRAVWELAESMFLSMVAAGEERIGLKEIFERLRKDKRIRLLLGDDFKINNNMTSKFARMLAVKYPTYADRLEFRRLAA
jgi:hypothetical protein